MWAENRLTAEGQVVHAAANEPGGRRLRGVRRVTALPLACRRLGIAGVADLVEFLAEGGVETAFPVEFKRGRKKPHRADEVQLCAQGLCLEEMTGHRVPAGALYYAETKRRVDVAFDAELRRLVETTVVALREVFDAGSTPPADYRPGKCRACSLLPLCRPQAGARSARTWRTRSLAGLLADGPE